MQEGFHQKSNQDGMFFTVKHHSIVRESKTAQPGFEPIQVKNPKTNVEVTKYIQKYDKLVARITKIEWYDTEQKYETRYMGWKIHLKAEDKYGVLDLPFNSRVSSRFMKLAEMIDYSKPVELRAWKDSRSDSTAFLVAQDEVSVPQKYTRENPGDMPPPIQRGVGGKWNYDDQVAFLHKRMLEVVIPKVNAYQPEEPDDASTEMEHGEDNPETLTPLDPKLIARVKEALTDLMKEKGYEDRSRKEVMEEFFGTTKFEEIEAMPPETVKAVLKKIDKIIIPF